MQLEDLVFLSGLGVGVGAEAALALRAVGVTVFWEKGECVLWRVLGPGLLVRSWSVGLWRSVLYIQSELLNF